jgi:tripartite-type tricarboxylate transporter receptor subunit TctC
LVAPAGTPSAIVEKISADVREVIDIPDVKNRLIELGGIPKATTPADFGRLIDNDRKRYAAIIKARGITAD